MILALVTAVAAKASSAGQVEAGAWGGLAFLASEHELYDPSGPHAPLYPAPLLGGRAAWRALGPLGLEAELGVGGALTRDDRPGPAAFGATSAHVVAYLPRLRGDLDLEPRLLVGGGLLGVASATDTLGRDLDLSFDWGLALARPWRGAWLARADLRHYVTAHHEIVPMPAHHLAMSVGFSRLLRDPSAGQDPDGDGILGSLDRCPAVAETRNGWKDEDGCPDALAEVRLRVVNADGAPLPDTRVAIDGADVGVTDGDGVLRVIDRTPGAPLGEVTLTPPLGSAAEPRVLRDDAPLREGVQERRSELSWLPGSVRVVATSPSGPLTDAVVTFRGAEVRPDATLGSDGDEVFVLAPGAWDLLLSAPGFGIERRTLTITPDTRALVVIEVKLAPAAVQTTREELVILQAVQFDFDKATLRPESVPLLREVANNLLRYDEVRRVEVQGHTDAVGEDAYNVDLSQRRVDTVVGTLVELGVARERLQAVGYGEACPLAANTTDAGMAENRRVQFIVLDPAPAGGIPCHEGVPARRASPMTIQRSATE